MVRARRCPARNTRESKRSVAAMIPQGSKTNRTGDQGDGTYVNPIVCADYSDPDVVRVDEDYYLTASSFNCMPGLPILHSRDLVNWSLIGHALERFPDPSYDRPRHGAGVWAPSIRAGDGRVCIACSPAAD